MADPRHHVRPGQALALAASQVNWINEQMRRTAVAGPQADGYSAPYTWVYVKNTSGATVARWGILAITGIEITPTSNATDTATTQYQEMPVLTGTTPTTSTTAWCVAIEPIASDKIGRAAVGGVVQCKVDITADSDNFVACKASAAELKSGGAGQGLVLWKQSGTGTGKWALVRLAGGAGGLRLGTISATWTKGATATVTEQNGDGSAKTGSPTFTATNYFADVTVASGTKRVACGLVDSTWILIAAEC